MDEVYVMVWYGIGWCEAIWCGMKRRGVGEGEVGREEERRYKGGKDDR